MCNTFVHSAGRPPIETIGQLRDWTKRRHLIWEDDWCLPVNPDTSQGEIDKQCLCSFAFEEFVIANNIELQFDPFDYVIKGAVPPWEEDNES